MKKSYSPGTLMHNWFEDRMEGTHSSEAQLHKPVLRQYESSFLEAKGAIRTVLPRIYRVPYLHSSTIFPERLDTSVKAKQEKIATENSQWLKLKNPSIWMDAPIGRSCNLHEVNGLKKPKQKKAAHALPSAGLPSVSDNELIEEKQFLPIQYTESITRGSLPKIRNFFVAANIIENQL